MRLQGMGGAAAMAAVVALIAGCGDDDDGLTAASLQLGGTAATGLALANSTVDVKCAAGSGSTTTNAAGAYTIDIPDGALPCIVKVTGTVGGAPLTLHSVAEAGSASGSSASVVANVTPLTEMIVARLGAAQPSAVFDSFGSSTTIDSTALAQATGEVLTALRDATGIDLGSTDPFKATLVAATPAAPTAGNDYDRLLDRLGSKVKPEALPLIVNQIASAAASPSTAAPVKLAEVMVAVNAGSLRGCDAAVSGKYRTIDYLGRTAVHEIDFGSMKISSAAATRDIVASDTQPCQFAVGETTFAMGPQGAGAYKSAASTGYIFPVQAHTFASVQGSWTFVESGVEENNFGIHFIGKLDVAADGKTAVCEYDVMHNDFSTCKPDTDEIATMQASSDGSFVFQYGSNPTAAYGYRSPAGTLTVFGTNNPSGDNSVGKFRTHFVLTKLQPLTLPALNTTTKYWDVEARYTVTSTTAGSPPAGTLRSFFSADSTTVTAVDNATGSFSRTRASDNRVDTLKINRPLDGLRSREATADASGVYQIPLRGLGMTAIMDAMPNSHFYVVSVGRP